MRNERIFVKKWREHIAIKSISTIVILLIAFTVLIGAIGYNGFTEALMTQYADGAFRTAKVAALVVDADKIDEYAASEGSTKDYLNQLQRLERVCNASGSTFIYLIQPDLTDYGHITFLFSTKNHQSDYSLYEFGYVRPTTNEEYREKYRLLYEGKSERELVVRDEGYIATDPHITAMIPMTASDGQTKAILCVQLQMDVLINARTTYVHRVILLLILAAVMVIIGQGGYLHSTLLAPIKKITDEASRFAAENTPADEKLQITIRNKDEIGKLAGSIDNLEEQIQRYVEDLKRITAEQEKINTEMGLAKSIQASMLPDIFPPFPDRQEFDIYASMDPAKEIGGDFYDFFWIDDDHLCLVIADVSGKGVPAALFMMASKIILQSFAVQGRSPAEILEKTNQAICSNNRAEMFVTVWLGILEIATGWLTAANAGHEYPVLKKTGGSFEILKNRHGLVIGAMEGAKYREYTLPLEPGSTLFVYTDGVPEATAADGGMFGTERMLSALNETRDAPPEQVLKNLRRAVDDFVKDAEQFDDLTMLCLEYRGDKGKESRFSD